LTKPVSIDRGLRYAQQELAYSSSEALTKDQRRINEGWSQLLAGNSLSYYYLNYISWREA